MVEPACSVLRALFKEKAEREVGGRKNSQIQRQQSTFKN